MKPDLPTTNAALTAALTTLRPDLHRFLSRMMGSVFDGEDALQDAMLAALRAIETGARVENPRAWMFRIARNTALNAIRARKSEQAMKSRLSHFEEVTQTLPVSGGTADTLRPLMALTPRQRSAVILFDVLGYSASEVADISDSSIDAVKSTLKRGRAALRSAPSEQLGDLNDTDKVLLARYTACFNAHDFDTIRAMLAEEVALDVVSIEHRTGAEAVGGYYSNYAKVTDWMMVPGHVDGTPTVLVFDREKPGIAPVYVIRLTFSDQKLLRIQDFRYARYVMQDVHWRRV